MRLDGARADAKLPGDLRGGVPLNAELEISRSRAVSVARGERAPSAPFRSLR